MTTPNLDINALLGSRICHDLISPIGAIGNGVELLAMSGAGHGPELSLISESVANANARIRFFRIAYGQAALGSRVSRAEVHGVITDLYRGSRLQVQWSPQGECNRGEVRLVFLLLQCMEVALPFGGQVHISQTDDAWRLQGEADKIKLDPALWSHLGPVNGKERAELSSAQVQFALAPSVAADLSRTIQLEHAERRIALTV